MTTHGMVSHMKHNTLVEYSTYMRMYIHAYPCILIHAYMPIDVHTYTNTRMHTYMHKPMQHVHTYIHVGLSQLEPMKLIWL